MLVFSETYQNYQNGALINQLRDGFCKRGCVGGESEYRYTMYNFFVHAHHSHICSVST
jgi:hypothetical protein